jgi:hypothetical protein
VGLLDSTDCNRGGVNQLFQEIEVKLLNCIRDDGY